MNNTQLKDTTIMWGALGFWGVFLITGFVVGAVAPGAFTPIMTTVAIAMLVGLGFYLPTLADTKEVRKRTPRMIHQYVRSSERQNANVTVTPGFVFAYARA